MVVKIKKYIRLFERYFPGVFQIIHNTLYLKRTYNIKRQLNRIEDCLIKQRVQYFLNGSLISYAILGGLSPKDIDLVIISQIDKDNLVSIFGSLGYEVMSISGDIIHFSNRNVFLDVFFISRKANYLSFYDGRKQIEANFYGVAIERQPTSQVFLFNKFRPQLPGPLIWYFLEVNCNIPPIQIYKQKRRSELLNIIKRNLVAKPDVRILKFSEDMVLHHVSFLD